MDKRPLKEIVKEIETANKDWKSGKLKEKPEILLQGPKPLLIKRKFKEPSYPIFPVLQTKVRGKSYKGERVFKLRLIEYELINTNNSREKITELKKERETLIEEIKDYNKKENKKRKLRKQGKING